MALVFVSYSRKDETFVRRLVDDLKQHNIPIWFDRLNIPAGANWDVAIEHALEDASHVLLVMSKWSVESENILDEIAVARKKKKKIIPIMIGDCDPPMRVLRAQYIDFRADYDKGLKDLLKVFAQAKVKYTTPEPPPEKSFTPAQERNQQFWEGLLSHPKTQKTAFAGKRPSRQAVLRKATGIKGLDWRYALHRQNISVQLYIGTANRARNKAIFDMLQTNKQAIEDTFGEALAWERLDKNKASRIKVVLDVGSAYSSPKEWSATQKAMIKVMIRLEEVFRPYLDTIAYVEEDY